MQVEFAVQALVELRIDLARQGADGLLGVDDILLD